MGRRGRKRRLDVESEYRRLVLSGIGTVEACQRLGIGRKTGYRWRAEHGGLPPTALSEGVRSQRYLSLLERQRIATLRRDGLGVRGGLDGFRRVAFPFAAFAAAEAGVGWYTADAGEFGSGGYPVPGRSRCPKRGAWPQRRTARP